MEAFNTIDLLMLLIAAFVIFIAFRIRKDGSALSSGLIQPEMPADNQGAGL